MSDNAKKMHGNPEAITLGEASDWLRSAAADKDGAICPCCERYDKVYNRPINGGTVGNLIRLYRKGKQDGWQEFHHIDSFANQLTGRDFPILRFIGLLERAEHDDEKKKTSGMYRITQDGIDFVEGRTTIPERLFLYHDELADTSEKRVSVRHNFPNFNYWTAMHG